MTRERAVNVTIVEDVEIKKWKNVNYKCLSGVSIAHIILGVIMICLSAPVTHWKFVYNSIGYGIWCGIVFLVTGIIGIVSTKYREYRSLVVSYMVLCLLSAAGAIVVLVLTISGDYNYDYLNDCHSYCGAKKAISNVKNCFAGVELTVAIWTGLNIYAEMFCKPVEGH